MVSHDRQFLDGCVDHILSLNRSNIEVQSGNFSSWMNNFERLKKDIHRLQQSAKRTAGWSDRVEASKIGAADKGFVGHKAAKMMKRSKAVLRKMDFERVQFEKDISEFSEGQKKKVLLAKSLCERAHLYVWDEPLNFIDVYSRMQIEQLIETFSPTMLLVEHDIAFREAIATQVIHL